MITLQYFLALVVSDNLNNTEVFVTIPSLQKFA